MNYTDVFGNETVPVSQNSYATYSLTADVQAYWPDNYSGSGLVLSNIVEVTSTDVYAITMPSAAEVSVGREVLIRNKGAFTITVLKNGGAALTSIAAGQATLVYVTDNSTAAGVWEQVLYGVGAASVDATSLIGYGIKAISTSLNQAHPVLTTVSSYLITVTDRAKVIVFAGGTASILLPSVSSIGNDFFFLLRNGGTGALTIDPNGSDTVDGLSVLTISPGESLIICSSGSEWFTIGYGRATEFNFTQLTKDVTAGGTIVLTAAEVANKLLTFVGSPTADLTVIVPNTVQVYYVYNNISTIYTITIKTAVGQGVRVFSTARLIVFCDSIDVVSAQAITSPSPSLSLQEQQVATDGQTVVAVPWAYVVGENQLRIYLNGLLQEPVDAYTETNSTTITFTEPLVAGWQILLVYTGGVTDVATFAAQLALPGTETGAELIGYLSAGDLSSATVQDALNELDTEKAALADLADNTGSDLVGYLPAGTGASIDRSVQDKLRESVSVFDFMTPAEIAGCVDGSVDVTAAIQAAIDSLPLHTGSGSLDPKNFANGGAIFLPRGRYKITSPVVLQRGIRLYGESSESSQILNFGTSSALLYEDLGGYIPDEIVIENLSVWQSPTVVATSGAGIRCIHGTTSAIKVIVRNVHVEATYKGVDLSGGIACSFQKVTVSKCVSHGFYFLPTADSGVTNTSTTFMSCYAFICGGSGYYFGKGSYISLVSCASDSNVGFGYEFNGVLTSSLIACGAEANAGGVASFTVCESITAQLFSLSAAGTSGVTLNNCRQTTLLGGYLDGTYVGAGSFYGINVAVAGGKITVIGTQFIGQYAADNQCNTRAQYLNLTDLFGLTGQKNHWGIGNVSQGDVDSLFHVGGVADVDAIYGQKINTTFTGPSVNRNAALMVQGILANSTVTYPMLVGLLIPNGFKGAAATLSRSAGMYVLQQTAGSTANANLMIEAGLGTIPAGDWNIYSDSTRQNYLKGKMTWQPPASGNPVNNGDLTFLATSDTNLQVSYKGSDGVIRVANLTLA